MNRNTNLQRNYNIISIKNFEEHHYNMPEKCPTDKDIIPKKKIQEGVSFLIRIFHTYRKNQFYPKKNTAILI